MSQSIMRRPEALLQTLAVLALLGGGLLVPRQALAVVPCTPPLCASEYTQLMNNIQLASQYAQQIQQFQKQIDQYRTQLEQYKQMFITGTPYKPTPSYRVNIDERFPERGINDKVAEFCGSAPKNNPVGVGQYANCVAKIQTENRRYNAMRELLKEVEANDKALEEARLERAGIDPEAQGALQANSNKMMSIQSKMQNDVQNGKYTIDAYNSMLVALNEETARLARGALNNENELLGTVVQGAALKLALKAARSRDR
ncbi:hypothetical protein [Lysobacter solisilvae (ex Woo and Kim 2020)]|uniref:Uncharacterized protein n=1 Tax=Agrilutibacter terrestris TaxID=2865112 RepID=A0A7H0FXV7_9GAMM|nr:hypothetical protein [Lysobacter terrestris]QNP40873.1 hypothetical protein H8B22_01005 [Lysobacter terrestris]